MRIVVGLTEEEIAELLDVLPTLPELDISLQAPLPRLYARRWRPRSRCPGPDFVEEWLNQPPATVVEPTGRHLLVMRDLLEPIGTAGNLTSDAHLAALAIEHGAHLVSFDRDFGRFPGLRWLHPAEDAPDEQAAGSGRRRR